MTLIERNKQYRAGFTSQGFCSTCLKRPASEGNTTCNECRESAKRSRAEKSASDSCVIYAIDIAGYRYIGSTHTWKRRKEQWRWSLKNNKGANPGLQSLYNEHGRGSLIFSVILSLQKETTTEERLMTEQLFIDATTNCLNVRPAYILPTLEQVPLLAS